MVTGALRASRVSLTRSHPSPIRRAASSTLLFRCETQAQRGTVTCPRAHSRGGDHGDWNPGLSTPKSMI